MPPEEPQTYEEQQAAIPKLKKKYFENNRLHTKCHQCPADRAAFPSWSALEDHYNTCHLKNPQHRCDYTGCDKVYGTRQTLKKHQTIHEAGEERVLNVLLRQFATLNAQSK